MTRYGQTRQSLKNHSLSPKKRFGQNFLVNHHTARAIVAAGGITGSDTVVEVGVGLGALTQPLAEAAKWVFGIEIDSGIIRFHEEEQDLPSNVTLIHQDILKTDLSELADRCGGPMKIMANLPYSISNPFLFHLIDNHTHVERATIMLQKEVADRLMATPGTKEYGIPTVLLQSCASIKKMLTVKPSEFHPRPKIDSVVVRIEFNHAPRLGPDGRPCSFDILSRIVRTTFHQRRKTILNTLSNGRFFPDQDTMSRPQVKKLVEQAIQTAGLSPAVRPETLHLEDFIRLATALDQPGKPT